MEFIPLELPGLVLIRPKTAGDERGSFIKNYSLDLFHRHGIDFIPTEQFYTISHAGVLRGMHFQAPPSDYGKLVHCARGRFHDAALDIRAGSPTHGRVWHGEFDDIKRETLYLPPGFAHGIYSLEPGTIVSYSVSHVHDPALDRGIRWNSFGHVWPGSNPIVSTRDRALPAFADFSTPFVYS